MELLDILENQFFPLNPQIADGITKDHYRRAVRHLSRVIGRAATELDLTDDNVLLVMSDCLKSGLSPVTANHRRKCLLCVWSWLARRGIVARWPSVRRLREPKRAPRAWTQQQLRAIIDSCKQCKGAIGGVPAANWWLALHGVCWDTGMRCGELLALRWEWLDWDRGVLHVPGEFRKGGTDDKLYRLMPDTLQWLSLITTPEREIIFAGIGHRSAIYGRYAVILKRAGLPCDRWNRIQKMRRSHATYVKKNGGDATSSLGHSSDYVTRTHYLDVSICEDSPAEHLFRILPPLPPAAPEAPSPPSFS